MHAPALIATTTLALDAHSPAAAQGQNRAMSSVDRDKPADPFRLPNLRRRSGRLPAVDTGRCTGCGRCVGACDLHLLSLEVVDWKKFAVLHEPDPCTGCSLCAVRCPFDAIEMLEPATGEASGPGAAPTTPAK
jgi:ferredoxin